MLTSKQPRGFSIIEGAIVVALVCVIGALGYFAYTGQQKAVEDKKSNKAEDRAAISTTTDAYAGWEEYCSTIEKSCFRYPSDWKLTKTSAAASGNPEFEDADLATVVSPSGTSLVWTSFLWGLGGGCGADTPALDITAVTKNQDGLYTISYGKGKTSNMAIVADLEGKVPAVGKASSCLLYPMIKSKDGKREMWLMASGLADNSGNIASIPAADQATLNKILASYSY